MLVEPSLVFLCAEGISSCPTDMERAKKLLINCLICTSAASLAEAIVSAQILAAKSSLGFGFHLGGYFSRTGFGVLV